MAAKRGKTSRHPISPRRLRSTILEASHHDANTAYVAAGIRNDSAPYIYRTHDAGKTWQKITDGLQPGWGARVVREDPVRKGLLYAGTENAVYVSFDDGDHWQSLAAQFPRFRCSRSRGSWQRPRRRHIRPRALDSRRPFAASPGERGHRRLNAYLLRPATAVRVRFDNDQETPLPPETPTGKNPPDGAIFYYYLKSPPPANSPSRFATPRKISFAVSPASRRPKTRLRKTCRTIGSARSPRYRKMSA